MAGIIDSGTAPNLINGIANGQLVPDAKERKFVTFVNELGGVHTIIVDVEHAAETADELLQWFEHTRAQVTASASLPTDPNHRTPEQVIDIANQRMGFSKPDENAHPASDAGFNPQGG